MTLTAALADITTLDVDAIVNAANEGLTRGGGVCGAIHQAAGPELARACAALGGCPVGGAKITPGFRLPARYVIHAVGPVWRGGTAGEPGLLAAAYRASVRLAVEHGLTSLAFPAISTGIFGYPIDPATTIAVETVRAAAGPGASVTRVVFACFSADALAAYERAGVAVGLLTVGGQRASHQ
jgi:O-acetyl-ADP-ribose deacetylase (regulator of RNase III)